MGNLFFYQSTNLLFRFLPTGTGDLNKCFFVFSFLLAISTIALDLFFFITTEKGTPSVIELQILKNTRNFTSQNDNCVHLSTVLFFFSAWVFACTQN